MTDLALVWDADRGAADLALCCDDLSTDDGLQGAVLASLFSDALAPAGATLPVDDGDRRGCWMDSYPDITGDQIGSLLWLLSREKQTAGVLQRAKDYAQDALAWLIGDGAATSVDVSAEWVGRGLLGLSIQITESSGRRSVVTVTTCTDGSLTVQYATADSTHVPSSSTTYQVGPP